MPLDKEILTFRIDICIRPSSLKQHDIKEKRVEISAAILFFVSVYSIVSKKLQLWRFVLKNNVLTSALVSELHPTRADFDARSQPSNIYRRTQQLVRRAVLITPSVAHRPTGLLYHPFSLWHPIIIYDPFPDQYKPRRRVFVSMFGLKNQKALHFLRVFLLPLSRQVIYVTQNGVMS